MLLSIAHTKIFINTKSLFPFKVYFPQEYEFKLRIFLFFIPAKFNIARVKIIFFHLDANLNILYSSFILPSFHLKVW